LIAKGDVYTDVEGYLAFKKPPFMVAHGHAHAQASRRAQKVSYAGGQESLVLCLMEVKRRVRMRNLLLIPAMFQEDICILV